MPDSRLWSIPLFALALTARAQQSAAPRLQFEVASVKVYPMAPNGFMMRMNGSTRPIPRPTGNRFTARMHVIDLITIAYGLFDYEVSGLPDWAQSPAGAVFQIDAKAEGDSTPSSEQLQQMLQSLLEDRFQLHFHKETKEISVYALVLGKNGSKMRQMTPDEEIPTGRQPEAWTSKGRYTGLFSLLTVYADRPIVDETGLSGNFESANLNLGNFAQQKREDLLAAQDTLRAAVAEKLGLKLEPRKTKMEILIVDRIEQPSPN